MLLAILADIHGNLPALTAVLADIKGLSVDGILVAGDLVGGTDSPQILERLHSTGCTAIRGNREGYLLAFHAGDGPESWFVGRQWASLRLVHRQLDQSALAYVDSLPEQCTLQRDDAPSIRVVHGTPEDVSGLLVPECDRATVDLFEQSGLFELSRSQAVVSQALAEIEEEVLVCGLTHIPWVEHCEGRLVLNPGSVGLPINGDARAQYALLSWRNGRWATEHRAAGYDLAQVRHAYQSSGLLDEKDAFARASLLCALTGYNVPGLLVLHSRRLAASAGYADLANAPDSIWDEAVTTFDWGQWEAMT